MEYKLEHNLYENRWHILPVILLGPLMATLDSSIVNVALPDMSQKLSVGINTIQWVVTSYLIAISALILIFGRIADIIGKAKIFQYGFVIFSVGSLLCGFSKNVGFLIFSRIIQAVGASMTMSSNQGLIAAIFPPNERGKALGLSATTVAIGTMMGPPLGGIMVEIFNWETIFWINVPIGIGAFFLGRKMLPKEERKESKDSFDLKGAILFMSFVVSLFWAMLSGEKLGWMNKYIIVSFIVAVASFFSFYFVETKEKSPMLDFSMFDNKIFNVSIFCAFVSFMVIFCYNIINPFYLQYIMNISPAKAGILMIVYPISAGIIASMSGDISDRLGSEITTFWGLLVTTIGLVLLSFLNTSSTYIDIVTKIAILGFGNGLFQSPNNTIVMSLVPKNKLGITGSINALVRNMGMVFGIAFSVALLYNRMSHSIGYRVVNFVPGRPDVFIYAMKFVYLSAASICIIGIILTFLRIMEKRKRELLIR
ncbi:MFS transporter [Clostridium magnum]|uniref:Multidrug resistance protein Stp n=1 Tax=Clostridium magnum DSM 2767 TaxID=1121326 RepID=A0A162R6I6_9CLOT|nr:MFS transporter [Clostridium magnum]KZL89504.1 multidrug resistance protein Stp [Clostridium magnum DSM 2767]SHH70762.1 drug resistance transporter, EmrB/QacA subfamily [Clostridium magnum DSM 2767]